MDCSGAEGGFSDLEGLQRIIEYDTIIDKEASAVSFDLLQVNPVSTSSAVLPDTQHLASWVDLENGDLRSHQEILRQVSRKSVQLFDHAGRARCVSRTARSH